MGIKDFLGDRDQLHEATDVGFYKSAFNDHLMMDGQYVLVFDPNKGVLYGNKRYFVPGGLESAIDERKKLLFPTLPGAVDFVAEGVRKVILTDAKKLLEVQSQKGYKP